MFEDFSDPLLMLEAQKKGMHRTLRGTYVKVGSEACRKDIEKRIEDIKHNRDTSNHGTDARSYYSGVLRVLRRKLRENDKIMLIAAEQPKKKSNSKKIVESEDFSLRLLTLSGIF